MGKWIEQFKTLIWAVSVGLAAMAYMYQAFATKEYVQTKNETVMQALQDIKDSVKSIDERLLHQDRYVHRAR